MHRALKWLLVAIGGLVGLLLVAAIVVYALFDASSVKLKIEQAVASRTGRTLTIEGNPGLIFFPSLGLVLGKTTLSEPKSTRPAAHVDAAKLSVALLPLLSKEVRVDRIVLDGLNATIVRNRDGTTNFDDLKGHGEARPEPHAEAAGGAPVQFDIGGVAITHASVTWRDSTNGTDLALTDLALKTGRLAEGVKTPVELSVHLQGKQPAVVGDLRVKGDVLLDLAAQRYVPESLDASFKGSLGARVIDVSVVVNHIGGSSAAMTAQLSIEASGTEKKPTGDSRFSVALKSPVAANLDTLAFDLSQIVGQVDVTDPALSKQKLAVSLAGRLRAEVKAQKIAGQFDARIDDAPMKLKFDVAGFDKPRIGFDLDTQSLDLDKLFPPGHEAGSAAPKPAAGVAGTADAARAGAGDGAPVDLSALKSIDLDGKVHVAQLVVRGIKASAVNLGLAVHGGTARVAPMHLALYGGSAEGTLSADAHANRIAIAQKLAGVDVGALLRDAAKLDKLEGRGAVALDVTGAGATVGAIKRSLAGSASVRMVDGALKGFDYAKRLRTLQDNAQSAGALAGLAKGQGAVASSEERTDFSELSVSFSIAGGVATSKDLDVKAPLLRLGGAGAIDVGHDRIDYTVVASLVNTLRGQGGTSAQQAGVDVQVPVRVVGALAGPAYEVQWASAAGSVLQNVLRARGGGLNIPGLLGPNVSPASGAPATAPPPGSAPPKDDPGKALRDQLKGLLGR